MDVEERIARATIMRAKLCGLVAEYAALERADASPDARDAFGAARRDIEAILDTCVDTPLGG